VLGENNRMLEVFGKSGCRVKRALEDGVFHVTFPTEETEEYLEASLARERHAAARVCAPCSSRGQWPSSARRPVPGRSVPPWSPTFSATGSPARSIRSTHVPKRSTACAATRPSGDRRPGGSRYHRRAGRPSRNGARRVRARRRARRRGHLGGLRRDVERGPCAQDRLRERARGSGMRLVGPNCMGVLNTDPAVSLNGTFVGAWPPAGNIGMLSQSGALGLAILDYVGRTTSASPASCRWATRPTCRATTCSATGPKIRAPV